MRNMDRIGCEKLATIIGIRASPLVGRREPSLDSLSVAVAILASQDADRSILVVIGAAFVFENAGDSVVWDLRRCEV